jgi:hypothetical protein
MHGANLLVIIRRENLFHKLLTRNKVTYCSFVIILFKSLNMFVIQQHNKWKLYSHAPLNDGDTF